MFIIELVFELFKMFVPVKTEQILKLEKEAQMKFLDFKKKDENGKANKIEKQVIHWSEHFFVRLAAVFLYLPVGKWLSNMRYKMENVGDPDGDFDDYD